MTVTIYHNPRCSKSRETLSLLKDAGYTPEIIEYLIHPPSKENLEKLLSMLRIEPKALLRKKETIYKELNLANLAKTDDEIIQAMADHPILIERPIVVSNKRAALGRPPEAVLKIL